MRNFFGVLKSSLNHHPPMFAPLAVGLNNSTLSVGGGVSVRERISLTSTGGIAGEIGSLVPGDPSSWPPERQFDLLSQESGSACSSTTTSEKPRPSVIGYQLSLYSK